MRSADFEISAVVALPDQIDALAGTARDEGYAHVDRLIADFKSGQNRFDNHGEALFVALRDDTLLGVGGLNRDPYDVRAEVGRVRRVYVHPAVRRCGVASALMAAIEKQARQCGLRRLNLYTSSTAAGRFYGRLGFRAVTGVSKISHTKALPPVP